MIRIVLALSLAGALTASAVAAPQQARERRSCIDFDRVVTRRAVASDRLEFTLVGGRRYQSTITQICPNLGELNGFYTLVADRRDGSRVCAGDRFRMANTATLRTTGATGPFCRFGPFTPLPR